MIVSQLLSRVLAISTPFMLSNILNLNLGEEGGWAERQEDWEIPNNLPFSLIFMIFFSKIVVQ